MPDLEIEFSLTPLVEGHGDVYPHPYPASREIPEWFKSMPLMGETEANRTLRTVKNCPPFLEAMTCGYIIPLATDICLTLDPTGLMHGESGTVQIVHYHSPTQVPGAPFQKYTVVKILSPWLVRTPPGYSTLFQPLLNRFDHSLIPLAGLVETDLYYRNDNFPAVVTIQPGSCLTLRRGTPLVQAIPIKRDDFQSKIVPADVDAFNVIFERTHGEDPEDVNYYKNNIWRKKNYR